MPTARTPYSRAACSTIEPQPQPTSSSRVALLQPELAADQVELVALGVLQAGDAVVAVPQ